MTLERMKAAMHAVSAHTRARDVDDAGDPVGIGCWHLVYSLADMAEDEGLDFEELVAEAESGRASERRTYLVKVEDVPGPATVAMQVMVSEYEVTAGSLSAACLLVKDGAVRHTDVKPRTTHAAYTGDYLRPDPERYAAYGAIRARQHDDIPSAAMNARRIGFAPALDFPESQAGPARGAEAARVAVDAFSGALGVDAGRRTASVGLIQGIMDLCDRSGEDFKALVKGCLEDRDDIMGRSADKGDTEVFVAGYGYGYGP